MELFAEMEGLNMSESLLYDSLGWMLEDGWYPTAAHPLPRADLLAVSAVYGVVFTLGVVGNIAVGVSVCGMRDLRTATNYFLLNLSVADLFVLLVCMPISLLETWVPFPWLLGDTLCKFVPFTEMVVFQASILTMVAVSADRYQGVCRPLLTQASNRRRRALLCIALVWGLSLAASSPMLRIATYMEYNVNGSVIQLCDWSVDVPSWKSRYATGVTVGFFVVPLLALSGLYAAIGRRLTRRPAGETNARLESLHRSRRRVVLMLGTVVLMFFVCLLPHRVFQLWLLYAPQHHITSLSLDIRCMMRLTIFMRMMVYINSSLNPVIYTLFSTRFRDAFFKCCSTTSSRRSDVLARVSTTTGLAHRNNVDGNNRTLSLSQRHRLLLSQQPADFPSRPGSDVALVALTRLTSFPVARSANGVRCNHDDDDDDDNDGSSMCIWESQV